MSASLSRYLKDFGAPAPVAPRPRPTFSAEVPDDEPISTFDDFPAETIVDLDAERREAYAEGHEVATDALALTHAAEIEQLTAAHADELKAIREKYELEMSLLIPERIRQISSEIADAVSAATAEAIAPILESAVAEKAVDALAELVREIVLDGVDSPIVVKGSSTLFALLKTKFAPEKTPLRHIETEDLDLSVEIGDAVLVTRMSAWAASLKGVLE